MSEDAKRLVQQQFSQNAEAYVTVAQYVASDTIRLGVRVANAGTTSHSGMAVSLKAIRDFLDNQNVRYQEADSGVYNSADRLTASGQVIRSNLPSPLRPTRRIG